MNLSNDVFDLLAKALGRMRKTARRARDGKHYRGSRPQGAMGRHAHDRLAAARKRERQNRLYGRACANGRKHRYGRP